MPFWNFAMERRWTPLYHFITHDRWVGFAAIAAKGMVLRAPMPV